MEQTTKKPNRVWLELECDADESANEAAVRAHLTQKQPR